MTYVRNGMITFIFATLLAAFVAFVPAQMNVAHAQEADDDSSTTTDESTDTSQIQAMLAQVQQLMELIQSLQEQLNQARGELQETIHTLRTDLKQGMTDDDIEEIQELLAADPEVYPEGLATGFFGPLTERALTRLQRCHGLPETGEIDEDTKELLEAFLSSGKVNPGQTRKLCRIAQRSLSLDSDGDPDDISENSGSNTKICHKGRFTISVGAPAARAHLAHGDTLGRCADDDDDADSESDENESDEEENDEESDDDSDENDDESDDDSDENDDDSDDDSDDSDDDDDNATSTDDGTGTSTDDGTNA